MKQIVKGLIGREDMSVGFGTFVRTTSTGGTQTMTQVPLPARGVYYVGDDFATYWGSSDIGAQMNAAYAAMPSQGGIIEVTPPLSGSAYSFSTPVLFNTAHKYVRIRGLGTGNTVSGFIHNGVILNFTPTAGGASLTLTGCAAGVSGTSVYSGTITGGAANALRGTVFQVKGFASALNNGYFACTASTATTLTLSNGRAILDAIGGTANPLTTAIKFANDGGAEGDGYNPAQGLESIILINNEATTANGGTSNGTCGLDFTGAGRITLKNVLISGFGVGAQFVSGGGWNSAWYQTSIVQNNVGLLIYDGQEMFNWFGGALAVNDVGASFSGKSIPAANSTFHGVSIDSNVTFGIKETAGSLQTITFIGCHFENLAGGGLTTTTHYIYTESATVLIHGGTAIDDATSGTAADYWFSVGWSDVSGAQGNYFFLGVYGLLVQPSGRTSTLVFRIGGRAFLSGLNSAPSNVTNLSNASVRGPGFITDLFQNNNGSTEHAMEISGKLTVDGGLLGGSPNKQVFTGSGTFTIPAGVLGVKVTVVGGGGGGGGSTAGGNVGCGGGSGGVGIKWLGGLTPGNTLAVTVGGGGAGNSGAAGSNGIASSVASGTQTITTITANPGFGGNSGASPQAGQIGGTAGTGGDINLGGGGTSGGITGLPSCGGTTIFGGAGASGGNAGVGYGAGGGGALNGSTTAGGVGQQGVVIFEWIS